MKLKQFKKILITVTFGLMIVISLIPLFAQAGQNDWFGAVGLGGYGLVPERCASGSNCELGDFVVLAVNVANLILGVSGTIALVLFVIGGFTWIVSGGNTAMIDKGRKTLVNAIIGLAIIFGSWMIINFTIAALTSTDPWTTIKKHGTGVPIEKLGIQNWSIK